MKILYSLFLLCLLTSCQKEPLPQYYEHNCIDTIIQTKPQSSHYEDYYADTTIQSEPQLLCYECWSADSTVHEFFMNTTQETMEHTINWWATNPCMPMTLNCKIIEP